MTSHGEYIHTEYTVVALDRQQDVISERYS